MPPDTTVTTALEWVRARGFIRDPDFMDTMSSLTDLTLAESFHGMPSGIVELLCYAGSGVEIDSDPHEDMAKAYRDMLDEVAACTSGTLRITDVAVNDVATLTFKVDGQEVAWDVFDGFADGYLDRMTFVERMGDLTPPGSGRWAHVMGDGIPINMFLFGEPEHLRELSEWGVEDLAIYETG